MKFFIISYLEETGYGLETVSDVYYCTSEKAVAAAELIAEYRDDVALFEGKIAEDGRVITGDKISDFPSPI